VSETVNKTMTVTDRALTTEESAEFLGQCRQTVVRLINRGALPSFTSGRSRRVMLSDLRAYVERLKQEDRERRAAKGVPQ
jgi:excisionase family DNA binding protein